MLSSIELKNKPHFLVWKGGRGPPQENLKTKKAGKAISGDFVGAILPLVKEECQRMLLPFILNKDLERYAYICISLVCVLQDITVQI